MSKSTPNKTNAIVLVSSPEWAVKKDGVTKLQELAVAQLSAIGEMENKAAMGGVLAGLTLLRVKASMPHGTFRKWMEQMCTSGAHLMNVKVRQANYYMSLALIFLEKSKVQKPDLLALPGDQTLLDLGDSHEAKGFLAKLRKFAGGCSLNELLIKHDIKSVGLKKALAAEKAEEEKAEGDTDSAPPAKTPQEACMEIMEAVFVAQRDACDQAVWMQMSRQQHDDLRAAFESAAERVRALHIQTHGRKAKD